MKCNACVPILFIIIWSLAGACAGSNTVTHTNTAVAMSPGWSQGTVPDAFIGAVQIQKTFTAVLGEDNTVTQSNRAEAYSSGVQIQDNFALVDGNRNSISQDNVAVVIGNTDIDYIKLVQKNLVLIQGSDNVAVQSNMASNSCGAAEPDTAVQMNTASSTVTDAAEHEITAQSGTATSEAVDSGVISPIDQLQVNAGIILGDRNWLYQFNRAGAFKYSYPFIWKRQINRAVTVKSGEPALMEDGVLR